MVSKLMRIVIPTWFNYMHELKPQFYLLLLCTSADELSSYIIEITDAIQMDPAHFHPAKFPLCSYQILLSFIPLMLFLSVVLIPIYTTYYCKFIIGEKLLRSPEPPFVLVNMNILPISENSV